MKRIKRMNALIAFIFCLVLLSSGLGHAADVTVVVEGASKQEATNNAARAAVEQSLGVYIESKAEVKDFKTISDKIAAASAGYVKNITVLAEGKDPISGTYKIKALVSVDDNKLKGALEEFLNDPRAKKVFQETKFNQRRIVVVYSPQSKVDLPYDSKPVKDLMSIIEDKLVGHGFRVFLPDQLTRIRGRAAESVADVKTAIGIATQEQADAVILVSFDVAKSSADDGFTKLMATVLLKAYDVTTGELFCNINSPDKVIMGGSGIEEPMSNVVRNIGPKSSDDLTAKIVDRFSTVRTNFVYLVFKNMPLKHQDKIEDVLEDIGWKYKTVKQVRDYLELEVFTDADMNTVRRKVRKSLEKMALPYEPVDTIGQRVIFDKEAGGKQ